MAQLNLMNMRKTYCDDTDTFDLENLESMEPFKNFSCWFDDAVKCKSIYEANAMSLATASNDGKPTLRIVLLKSYSKDGFVFFTNYESQKGKDLKDNPYAAATFYWVNYTSDGSIWSRQVHIKGKVEKVSEKLSIEYFKTRPRNSQLAAHVSHFQSNFVKDRNEILIREKEVAEKFLNSKEIEKPDYWGGYVIIPDEMEFWQGQTDRVHDRILFQRPMKNENIEEPFIKGEDGWIIRRLLP